jgi:hypothetical protein
VDQSVDRSGPGIVVATPVLAAGSAIAAVDRTIVSGIDTGVGASASVRARVAIVTVAVGTVAAEPGVGPAGTSSAGGTAGSVVVADALGVGPFVRHRSDKDVDARRQRIDAHLAAGLDRKRRVRVTDQ